VNENHSRDDEARLFGEVAFELGHVTTAQLYEALTVQARREARGEPHRFLGEILVGLGYLTEPKVLEILAVLHDHDQRRIRDR
jgi:hypothetical protein